MTTPVRIQRRRTRGYDMQAESLALNGLPAVSVCRPGKWGNPFQVKNFTTAQACINHYEWWLRERCDGMRVALAARQELRGKNLACFCPLDAKWCHADVLLRIANTDIGETRHSTDAACCYHSDGRVEDRGGMDDYLRVINDNEKA